jgi:quinol monooxygenase YgiN
MSMHFIVRFEPLPGKEAEFRQAMLRNLAPTRAEAGCLAIHIFETIREPLVFSIHSEWVDEAAFELHARLPHTVQFLEAAKRLLTNGVNGLRTREIGADIGASAAE